jgi:hypothetical protein
MNMACKILNTMMRKGALVVENTLVSEILFQDPQLLHELLSHGQCAPSSTENPKVVPCFLNLLLKLN